MPRQQIQHSRTDLFGIAIDELERSVTKPNILSYTPYPEQERFHRCDKPGRYIAGANRAGKTDCVVVDAIWHATNTHPFVARPDDWGSGAIQIRFVVVDVEKGINQIILPKLKRWCSPSMLVNGSFEKSWNERGLIFTFSNGSTIDFLTHGMDLDKHGGVPRHIIYFDEEPPQAIFNENMMRLIDYDGWWVISATSTRGIGWTYDLLFEPADINPDNPDVGAFTLTQEMNPYLKALDRGRFYVGMNEADREIREEGKFVARHGLIFPQFVKFQSKFILPQPFIPSKSWDWYSSTDHGWNNPTAWLWHAVGPQGQIVTFAEHYKDHLTIPEHCAIVHDRERAWGKEPDMRVGDPAMRQEQGVTGTSPLTEYAIRGLYIAVENITNRVEIGIEKMQQYLKIQEETPWGHDRPMWMISPNCTNFIRELKKLRWAAPVSDRMAYDQNAKETVHKKDDHAFDSARYFSTLMPDLTPDEKHDAIRIEKGKTLSYEEIMYQLSNNPDVRRADDGWDTVESYGDLYRTER